MAGHAPASAPMTAKCCCGSAAHSAMAAKKMSTRKRRPAACAHIQEVRTPIILAHRISALHAAHREQQRPGHPRGAEPDPGTGLEVIGPVERLGVANQVAVPKDLCLKPSQRRRRDAEPRLRVEQQIVIEAADLDAVRIRLENPAGRPASDRMAKALPIAEPATI